jgi:hypothetical protein
VLLLLAGWRKKKKIWGRGMVLGRVRGHIIHLRQSLVKKWLQMLSKKSVLEAKEKAKWIVSCSATPKAGEILLNFEMQQGQVLWGGWDQRFSSRSAGQTSVAAWDHVLDFWDDSTALNGQVSGHRYNSWSAHLIH